MKTDKSQVPQLTQNVIVGRSEQFYCNQDDGDYNNNPCSEQCRFCKEAESLQQNCLQRPSLHFRLGAN